MLLYYDCMFDGFCKTGPESQTSGQPLNFLLFIELYGQRKSRNSTMAFPFFIYFLKTCLDCISFYILLIILLTKSIPMKSLKPVLLFVGIALLNASCGIFSKNISSESLPSNKKTISSTALQHNADEPTIPGLENHLNQAIKYVQQHGY